MGSSRKTNSPSEVDEEFLLQALRRLPTPEQRYVFTMMVDLISHGLTAGVREPSKGKN